MPDIYLLRITEAGRVVAQAKLEVFDKPVAMRNLYEVLPQILPNIAGAMLSIVQVACSDAEPAADLAGLNIDGNHSGIEIAGQMPPTNGHAAPNRDARRHPGF